MTHIIPALPEERFRIFVTIEIKDTNIIKHVAVSESSRATISKSIYLRYLHSFYVGYELILIGDLKRRIEQEYARINEESLIINSDLLLNDIFPVSDSNVCLIF
jgi:hypothetical protein